MSVVATSHQCLKNKGLRKRFFDTPQPGHYDTAPMPRPREPLLDAENLATAGSVVEQEYEVERFARLADRLARPEGKASVRLRLSRIDNLAAGELQLRAMVELVCQRCLSPVRRVVESESRLAFVPSDDVPAPSGYEAVACDPRRLDLAALVEDELLLALPHVARHAPGENCALPAGASGPAAAAAPDTPAGTMRRPFAGLKDLLKH
jgi:uncharacterized protein